MTVLEIKELTAGYGPVKVLNEISFSVESGELFAIVGANGAGKSTLLRTISGLTTVHAGTIQILGKLTQKWSPPKIARYGVAHVPENRRVFPLHTIDENLRIAAYVRRDKGVDDDIERLYDRFTLLDQRRRQMAGSLSGGQQQILAIAMGLIARPQVLVLDEPSLGLAPIMVRAVFDEIRNLRASGDVTLILVEQLASLALEVADNALALKQGRVVAQMGAAEMRANPTLVQSAYLAQSEAPG